MDTITLTAPAAWASYLINGDASGIEDDEQAAADAWIAHVDLGSPTDCSEEIDFIFYHDARLFAKYGADCATYTFIKHNEDSAPVPPSVRILYGKQPDNLIGGPFASYVFKEGHIVASTTGCQTLEAAREAASNQNRAYGDCAAEVKEVTFTA